MLNKQPKPQWLPARMGYSVLDHFGPKFILRHPCHAFHWGLRVAPPHLLISLFQLDIIYPKQENEPLPRGVELS